MSLKTVGHCWVCVHRAGHALCVQYLREVWLLCRLACVSFYVGGFERNTWSACASPCVPVFIWMS